MPRDHGTIDDLCLDCRLIYQKQKHPNTVDHFASPQFHLLGCPRSLHGTIWLGSLGHNVPDFILGSIDIEAEIHHGHSFPAMAHMNIMDEVFASLLMFENPTSHY